MALKIITCPWCGKEARITYEESRLYQMKCYSCHNTMLHEDRSFNKAVEFFEHHVGLLQAEKDGRLVVPPCKVGDKVFVTLDYDVMVTRVQGISVSASGSDTILHFGGYPIINAWGSEIGKTVYLTREEAEAALEGGKDHA